MGKKVSLPRRKKNPYELALEEAVVQLFSCGIELTFYGAFENLTSSPVLIERV